MSVSRAVRQARCSCKQRSVRTACNHSRHVRPLAASRKVQVSFKDNHVAETGFRLRLAPSTGHSTRTDWNRSDWIEGYTNYEEQPTFVELPVEGVIPEELCGTYLRNGPAKFTGKGHHVAHPFDGDGAVCMFQIQDGRVFFKSKFVRTPGYAAEQATGRPSFRGVFGSNLPGGAAANAFEVCPKVTANTGVLPWAGRMFALMEGGAPFELDPHSLATRGVSGMGAPLSPGAPFAVSAAWMQGAAELLLTALRRVRGLHPARVQLNGDAAGAHYRVDPATGRLVTFSYKVKVDVMHAHLPDMNTEFTFYEYNPDFTLHSTRHYVLDGYAFVHDFAITADYIVILQNPVKLHLAPFVSGRLCPIHCMHYQPSKPLRIHLVPRMPPRAANDRSAAGASSGAGFRSDAGCAPSNWQPATGACMQSADRSVPQGYAADWLPVPDEWDVGASPCNEAQTREIHAPAAEAPACVYNAPAQFVQHIANAWQDDMGGVNVQFVGYSSMPDFGAWSGPGRDWRDVDPDGQAPSTLQSLRVCQRSGHVRVRTVSPRVLEFPSVHPARVGLPSRYVFGAAALHACRNRPQQSVAVYDAAAGSVSLWSRGWRYYVGEPAFVPRRRQNADVAGSESLQGAASSDEDELDGWLLALCYDAAEKRSELVVLDARDVQQGPLAVVPLPRPVPHGLHGAWHASC